MDGYSRNLDLDLFAWRRTVAEMYARVRQERLADGTAAARFRAERDHLFRTSSQTPLSADRLATFSRLAYFEYNPAWKTEGRVVPAGGEEIDLPAGDDGTVRARQFGNVQFELAGRDLALPVYWITGYGGGVFLPFRDRSSGKSTYGGGRYLFDTIKGADLGGTGSSLVLDFNYAYNPSCAYDDRWTCPLPRAESFLDIDVAAGERAFR